MELISSLLILTFEVLAMNIDALGHFQTGQLQHSGRDGGCRVGKVRAGTTSPMPNHKGFKLQ